MPFDPIYLFYGIIFIGVALLAEGALYLYADTFGGRRVVNRRMRLLAEGADAQKVLVTLRRETQSHWAQFGWGGALVLKLDTLITQSGLTMSLDRMLTAMAGITVLSFAIMVFYAGTRPSTLLFIVILSVAIGVGLPMAYLQSLKQRRLKRFEEQLPDALDTMVRALRAGLAINIAISLTAKQMPDPIGTEFGLVLDEIAYGRSLQEAMTKVGERVPLQDFQFVVMAVTIQHDTGGDLAGVLSGLATLIRSRFRMLKRIRALSAEGRFSAKVLSAMPFVFGALLYVTRPEYYLGVLHDPLFIRIIAIGFGLQLFGILIMQRMIKIRV